MELFLNGERSKVTEIGRLPTNKHIEAFTIRSIRRGYQVNYDGLFVTRFITTPTEAKIWYEDYKKCCFPVMTITAWLVVYISGGIAGIIFIYALIGTIYAGADEPEYWTIFHIFLSTLDITSDYQMLYELYFRQDEYWPYVAVCCFVPACMGFVYFIWWYRQYTSKQTSMLLQKWLLTYKIPFFCVMFFASANLGFFKILWSRISPLWHHEFFNMPIKHEQQLSLLKGKLINVFLEEIPLTIIQVLILYREATYTTDVTNDTNSSSLDANGELAVVIALGSSMLGFLVNIVSLVATSFDTYEVQMQVQNVLIHGAKKDPRLYTEIISSAFANDLFRYRVFAWRFNDGSYQLQFFHGITDETLLRDRIYTALAQFADPVDIELMANPITVNLVDHIVGSARLLGETEGSFKVTEDFHKFFFKIPVANKEFFKEFIDRLQIVAGKSFKPEKKYSLRHFKEMKDMSWKPTVAKVKRRQWNSLSQVVPSRQTINEMGNSLSQAQRIALMAQWDAMYGEDSSTFQSHSQHSHVMPGLRVYADLNTTNVFGEGGAPIDKEGEPGFFQPNNHDAKNVIEMTPVNPRELSISIEPGEASLPIETEHSWSEVSSFEHYLQTPESSILKKGDSSVTPDPGSPNSAKMQKQKDASRSESGTKRDPSVITSGLGLTAGSTPGNLNVRRIRKVNFDDFVPPADLPLN